MKRLDLIINALEDMLSGWKYIRESHGDLYGVGWDRAENKAVEALAAARSLRELEPVGVCVEATIYSQNEVDWYGYTPDAGTKLYALGDEK